MPISKIDAGGTTHDINAVALETPATLDGMAFDGGDSVTRYGVCSTAAATAAKVVTIGGDFTLDSGATVRVKFSYGNTASAPTLNVNGSGAVTIMADGSTAAGENSWQAGEVVTFTYDGTYFGIGGGNTAAALSAKAPLASPVLTGTPEAPTAEQGTNSDQIATTAFVAAATGDTREIALAAYGQKSVSGNPVVFYDGAENVPVAQADVVLTPEQTGSGTPTPANIRPFISYPGIVLTVDGDEDTASYSADWSADGTAAGGTADFVAGIMNADYPLLTLDGTEPWNVVASGSSQLYQYRIGTAGMVVNESGLCSHYATEAISSQNTMQGCRVYNSSGYARLSIRPDLSLYPTVTDFVNFLAAQYAAGTPVQVVYQATSPEQYSFAVDVPTTYQGFNRVSAGAGTVSVTYRADPTMAAREVLAAQPLATGLYAHADAYPDAAAGKYSAYQYRAVARIGFDVYFAGRYVNGSNEYYLGKFSMGSAGYPAQISSYTLSTLVINGTDLRVMRDSDGNVYQISELVAYNGMLYAAIRAGSGAPGDTSVTNSYLVRIDPNDFAATTAGGDTIPGTSSTTPVVAATAAAQVMTYTEKCSTISVYEDSVYGVTYLATGDRGGGWTLYTLDASGVLTLSHSWTPADETDDAAAHEWQHSCFFRSAGSLYVAFGTYTTGTAVYKIVRSGGADTVTKVTGWVIPTEMGSNLNSFAVATAPADATGSVNYLYAAVSPTVSARKSGSAVMGIAVLTLDYSGGDPVITGYRFAAIPKEVCGNWPATMKLSLSDGVYSYALNGSSDPAPNYVRVSGNWLITNNEDRGLAMFDITEADEPVFCGNIPLGDVWARYFTLDESGVIWAGGTYAYVKGQKNYLTVTTLPRTAQA